MSVDTGSDASAASTASGTRRVDGTVALRKRLAMTSGLFRKSNVDFLAHLDRTCAPVA